MTILNDLKRSKGLYIRCPECQESFSAAKARLFDATQEILPAHALAAIADIREDLKTRKQALKDRKQSAMQRTHTSATFSRIGKVVEKIVPALPGFSLNSSDCRALFDPIDYVEFHGLSTNGRIDVVRFIDVKCGGSRLSGVQKDIREVVETGKVSLVVDDSL